jgi:cytochrome P450
MSKVTYPSPPGPRSLPLIGVLPEVRRDALGFMMRTFQQYGNVSSYRLGPLRSHLIAHPDGVQRVLQENVKNYTKDHLSYGMLRGLVGDGLLTSQGTFWLRQRRLAQPAFHRQRIAAMAQLMTAATSELIAGWDARVSSGELFDIGEEMMKLTLRIVGDALFGTNIKAEAAIVHRAFNELSAQYIHRFRTFNLLPPVLPTPADRRYRQAMQELNDVVYRIIAERRRRNEDTGDLLSMLMLARDEETGESMDDKQLRDEVLTMLLAGHETTATTMTWVWAMLDQHPHVAERLQNELDDVLDGRVPTVEDLPRLTYTRQVIDETMRLYPPVYILSRQVIADDEIGGYVIKGGTTVDISMYITHRHPDFWPNPERFDPERFTPDQIASRPRFAYFPFSGGPRQCIGNSFAQMEASLILATIGQRYRLRLPENHTIAFSPLVTLRPLGGLPVRVEQRLAVAGTPS